MKKYYLIIFIALILKPVFSANCERTSTLKEPNPEWKFTAYAPFFSSAVIYEDLVLAGSLDSNFYAVELTTGKLIWKYKTNGEIRSAALASNGKIYFISGDGNLYCLEKSGKLIWSFKTEGEKKYDFADYHQSSPVFYANSVFFGSGDGNIYSVNSENGKLIWKYKTENVVHSTPAVDSSGLYIGSFDGYVYALNIKDGSLKWKYKTTGHEYFPNGEVQGSPAINNEFVFIGARDYRIYALDKENGKLNWKKSFSNGWVLSNTINGNELYIAGADERILACLDPNTGNEKWKRNMEFLMFGKPAFGGNTLFIGTTLGKLHAIDIITGNDLWIYSTDNYKLNKLKYFKEDDSYRDDIYSIIKSNEQFLEVEIELGGFFSTPAFNGKYLVAASTDGSVYCFKNY